MNNMEENKNGMALEREQEQNQEQVKQAQKEQGSAGANFSFNFKEKDAVDNELRKPRSRVYMELFSAIDMLSATDEEIIAQLKANVDEETAEEFMEMSKEELLEEIKLSFQEEFASLEVPVETVMHGVISKCYISGCDCHAIDASGYILEHYNIGNPMPENLAPGRKAFNRYPNCRCVEVYSDCCRVIDMDGSVTKIMNDEL